LEVEVRLLGLLKNQAGQESATLKLEDKPDLTVMQVVKKLEHQFGAEFMRNIIDPELNDSRSRVLILKNNVEIRTLKNLETPVKDGDKLVIIPISHGG